MPDTRVLTAHVPAGLAAKVDTLAERLDRSRGWIVKQALAAWVDQEEERHRRTLAALADVDAGRGVPHDQVKTWVVSLGTDKALPVPEPSTYLQMLLGIGAVVMGRKVLARG